MKANEPKASDLMVGDLVLGCIEGERVGVAQCKIPCRVVEIYENGDYSCQPITGFPDGIEFEDGDDFSWSESIPLTPKIMEKLGFIATHHPGTGATEETTEYTLERLCVIHNTEDWRHEYFSVRGLPCYELKWLHQLQHLMIGCGIEKEIAL